MQKRILEVVDYDPQWVESYLEESLGIQQALKGLNIRMHHIGSTSVPGLMAKPVIDILIETSNVSELDAYDGVMEAIGYLPRGEFGIPGRRFYLKGLINRTHHIHAFNFDTSDVVRHIAFRDYLIANQSVAAEYGALKSELAVTCNNDNDTYCDGKEEFVQHHERKALAWRACKQGGSSEPHMRPACL